MKIKLASGIATGVLMAFSAVPVFTQEQQPPPKVIIERSVQGPDGPPPGHGPRIHLERHAQGQGPMAPHGPDDFIFLATEMSFGGKLVKGSPYSAQAVTESTQTLGDGNRIVNKSTASIYRDSEGRTRREQNLRAIGGMKVGVGSQHVFINDPVAGTSFMLDPEARIARKMPPLRFKFERKPPPAEGGKPGTSADKPGTTFERGGQYRIEVGPDVMFEKKVTEGGVSMGWTGARNGDAKNEQLGKQNIEGVEAEGTRTTVTIPAGEIGNEREIQIVSERWYSPELQTIVMTRHSDPRFGENSYRLTNVARTEPARTLFEVPADYTVKEGPEPMQFRMRKPAKEKSADQ